MKTIIIPVQGRHAFINLFKLAANLFPDEPLNCRFLQIRQLPDNYTDLLTLSSNKVVATPFDEAFMENIEGLREKFGSRIIVNIDHIYGDSPALFRNYAEYRKADLIIYDQQEWMDSKRTNRLNIFGMVSRSGCELMYVAGNNVLMQDEPKPSYKKEHKAAAVANVPAGFQYNYDAVMEQLNEVQPIGYGSEVIAKKVSNLSRYFLSENGLQKMLSQSTAGLLLLTK